MLGIDDQERGVFRGLGRRDKRRDRRKSHLVGLSIVIRVRHWDTHRKQTYNGKASQH